MLLPGGGDSISRHIGNAKPAKTTTGGKPAVRVTGPPAAVTSELFRILARINYVLQHLPVFFNCWVYEAAVAFPGKSARM